MVSIKLLANDCQEVAVPKNKRICLFACFIVFTANVIPSYYPEEPDRKSICCSIYWLIYWSVNLSIHLSYKPAYLCISYTHCISLLIEQLIDHCLLARWYDLRKNTSITLNLSLVLLSFLTHKITFSLLHTLSLSLSLSRALSLSLSLSPSPSFSVSFLIAFCL